MKRTERHHLKENALVVWLVDAQDWIRRHQRALTVGLVALIVVLSASGGFMVWRARSMAEAAARLAGAVAIAEAPIVPPPTDLASAPPPVPGSYPSAEARLEAALPELLTVADEFPRTSAGLSARYQVAAGLATLERYEEAEQQYQRVVESDPNGLYGRMAELGLAEAAVRDGRHDWAIELFEQVAAHTSSDLPLDAILLQLARAYVAAGRGTDARQTFTRIVEEFPQSPYVEDAQSELEKLTSASG